MIRSRVALLAAMALLLAGCGSSAPSSSTSAAPASTASAEALDPADAAFVAQLRSEGLAPPKSASFPDAAYVTDANAVCKILALGEAPTIVKTDLTNMQQNRVSGYGITTDQAAQVIVLSAQTYCPAQVTTVKAALS